MPAMQATRAAAPGGRAALAAGAAGRPCSALLRGAATPLRRGQLAGQRLAGARPAAPQRMGGRAAGRALALPCRAGGDVRVQFRTQQEVEYGEVLRLVGSHPSLGNWKVHKGAGMAWGEGHFWSAEVKLPPGAELEFKCVRVKSGSEDDAEWEGGNNHRLRVPSDGAEEVSVLLKWGSGQLTVDGVPAWSGQVAPTPEAPGGNSSSDDEDGGSDGRSDYSSATSSWDDSMLRPQWQGKELRFMQSNEHTRERKGVWDTAGLRGAALHLVEGDRDAANWLGKLEAVKKLLVDQSHEMRPDVDAVAHAYIYMQWLATGAIECVEGGGHHRPNRHAELAQRMFRSLEWVISEQGPHDPVVAVIARRLQSRMPSFTEQFTQSVPLTRIRDIAHRNDIPKDLKAEIKHTLQNKLHRNAGPEDLHTTEAMLERITRHPGEFNGDFVAEFRRFTAELRDFFNAGSLTDMLDGVRPGLDEGTQQVLNHFGATKSRLDQAGESADLNTIMEVLHATTSVRAVLAQGLSSGLRNDAPDRALAMRQKWRQCEVRAEDYAFVLLSRFINSVEYQGGANTIASGFDGGWALPIGALVLGLRHVGLSGYAQQECMAVEQELAAWQRAAGFSERDNALRLKASLQRLRRITEGYSQELLAAYADRAVAMGRALGLDAERYNVFTEAEIRASLVFQLSKLCSLLIKAANQCAGGSPWDVLMTGEAEGVLLRVPTLQPGCLDAAGGKDCVLLVGSATGDEEVAALGRNLRGIILQQDLPHLSHLGVRARQEGVAFVTCEDEEAVAAATGYLMGQRVRLSASAAGVTISAAGGDGSSSNGNGNGAAAQRAAAAPAAVQKVGSVTVVDLQDATPATAGAKAAACGELLRLAAACSDAVAARKLSKGASNGASNGNGNGNGNGASGGTSVLAAADGVVLPFGCMEAALGADNQQARFSELLSQLKSVLGSMQGGSANSLAALDGLCADLQALLGGLRIPQPALQRISGAFKPGAAVIARSSANVEDLAGMSGAGLYESIPNVDSSDHAALQAAVAGVWASLFSRRAVLSRHAAGVPQEAACMAVVVQRQLAPDLCFVLHTRHPVTGDSNVLSAELAPGLGETLASGTRGSPWRLEADKTTGAVTTVAFANFSQALLAPGAGAQLRATTGAQYAPPSAAGIGGGAAAAVAEERRAPPAGAVELQVIDYSQQGMNQSADVRAAVGRRLLAAAKAVEHEFGGVAQDVEGCFVGNELYVVQSRPQP